MIVARAAVTDIPLILALEESGFDKGRWSRTAWLSEIEADDRYVLVDRERDGTLVAVASFSAIADTAELLRVVVAPAYRGQGRARALVRAGTQWAQAVGATRLLLEVEETNEAARRLYDRQGFRPIARRDDYYGPGRHALVCELELRPISAPSPDEDADETYGSEVGDV
jgi:ribosomal-protein-alanine N-acetyltransferase